IFNLTHLPASVPILYLCYSLVANQMTHFYTRKGTLSDKLLLIFISLLFFGSLHAEEAYLIQPGDVLGITVWKEEDLQRQVIVRPDGKVTFPLAGEIQAGGASVESLRSDITKRLTKYIPDPIVTVATQELNGNRIYVIGKVNRPGEFPATRYVDVVQALSMAGGTSTYAALNKIKILRRTGGKLESIRFSYSDIEKGNNLDQNIILQAGDVVIVP
ncbi:MAG: polysaccharide biosynthesis/export family protein, partial [Gammaproteobacteria bacterium]